MSTFRRWLQRAIRAGLLLVLILAPTQAGIELRPEVHLSPVDPLLALVAALWGLDLMLARDWRRLRPPPLFHLLFLAFAVASALRAPDRMTAAKDLVQLIEYFVVAHMLADWALQESRVRTRAAAVALISGAALIGIGAWHYLAPGVEALEVRSTFGNRNVFGGYLAMLLPLMAGVALGGGVPSGARIALGLLVLAGLCVNLSGASMLAIAAALLVVAGLRHRVAFAGMALLLTAVTVLLLPRLPRQNDYALFDAVALYDTEGQPTRRYPEWQAAATMALEHPWLGVGIGQYQQHVGQYFGVVPNATGPQEPDIQNLYLVLASSIGLCGMLCFLGMLLQGLRRALAAYALPNTPLPGLALGVAGALIGYLLAALGSPLLVRGIGLPLALLLALAGRLGPPLGARQSSG